MTTSENNPQPPLPPPAPKAGRPRPRRWFQFGAVLLGLLPFIALECTLRVFELGRPADQPDPFAGFNRNFPLFERHDAVYRTARSRAPFIAPQEFPAEKPANGFRVFCFGGSTVYGHPYRGDTAFPKWLELELAGRDPTRAWQVVNCGGISYASYRIAPLVKEVLTYRPDLIILATGHNEFLEDRTYTALKSRSVGWAWLQDEAQSLHTVSLAQRWLASMKPSLGASDVVAPPDEAFNPNPTTWLDNASGYASYQRDEAWQQRVIAQYDAAVRTIVADCQAAHVPILLVRLGSNLRDCPPYKSQHRAGLSAEREADWQAAMDLALTAERTDLAQARQYYLEAAAIDGEYALLNYRVARVLDRMDRPVEAAPYFLKAKDGDICPLRIITPIEQALVRIAVETGTPMVDAAHLLAVRSPAGIPGNDWYVDHVHPTNRGHQLIAQALADQLQQRGPLKNALRATWPDAQRQQAYARHLADLGPAYFSDGNRRVIWLENWAQRRRLAAEANPADAASYARLGFLRLDLGEDEAARAAFAEALRRDPAVASLFQDRAAELTAEGRPDRAALLAPLLK